MGTLVHQLPSECFTLLEASRGIKASLRTLSSVSTQRSLKMRPIWTSLALVLASLLYVQGYTCPPGKSKKTITLGVGESVDFSTQDADSYGKNVKCVVKFKKAKKAKCELNFSCSAFTLTAKNSNCNRGSDFLKIGKEKFCEDNSPDVTVAGRTLNVLFRSNKRSKGGEGAECEATCVDPDDETPTTVAPPATTRPPSPPVTTAAPTTASTSTTTTTTTTTTTAAPRNLIKNGNLEEGLENWKNRGCQLSLSTSSPFSGAQALAVEGRSAKWAGPDAGLELDDLIGIGKVKLTWAMKMMAEGSFDFFWTLKKTLTDGSIKYSQVVSGSISAGVSREWNLLEAEFEFGDLSNISELSIYMGGTPTDSSFYLDEVSLVSSPDWRVAANARIEVHRKSNLKIRVEGGGDDVSGLRVQLTQLSHSFPFGTAVRGHIMRSCNEGSADAIYTRYCNFVKDHFNYLVTHNAMKWQPCERREGVFSYDDADGAVAWAKANKIPMRGHALLWATGTQMPNWLDNYRGTELAEKVEKRINDALSHFNGSLTGWDVNNEMTHGEVLLTNTNDTDIRVKMYKWAHQRDPSLQLFVNDYAIISNPGKQGNKVAEYVALIRDLLDQGAPIHGIGVQAHMSKGGPISSDPEAIIEVVDQLATLNIPIWVTEFDWSNRPREEDTYPPTDLTHAEHAVAVDDFFRLMFSLPSVEGILQWGFWDKAHWRVNAALVNGDNFEVNAAGQAYLDLYHREWNSSTKLQPGSDGSFTTRGFHGNYQAELMRGDGVIVAKNFNLVVGQTTEITMTVP